MTAFWRNRAVFVTGGTGLLGGWLVKALVAQGADVVCLVRDWVPESQLIGSGMLSRVKTVRGDVCDQALMERILGEHEIETVFHLAAQAIVTIANRNPVSTFETNIAGTWRLLEACRRSPKISQVVVASSDKAYGVQSELPYREDAPLHGVFPYDASKSCTDLISQSFAESFDLPVCITRCGNFYGGGDLNWNRLIPGTIRSALLGERPVIRSDGKMIRDYFFIEDGAAAYMLLAEKMSENPQLRGQAFNFSTEQPLDVLSVVTKVLEKIDPALSPEVRGEANREIPEQYLSAEKARKVLGWKPLCSFDEGLDRTIEWYRSHLSND